MPNKATSNKTVPTGGRRTTCNKRLGDSLDGAAERPKKQRLPASSPVKDCEDLVRKLVQQVRGSPFTNNPKKPTKVEMNARRGAVDGRVQVADVAVGKSASKTKVSQSQPRGLKHRGVIFNPRAAHVAFQNKQMSPMQPISFVHFYQLVSWASSVWKKAMAELYPDVCKETSKSQAWTVQPGRQTEMARWLQRLCATLSHNVIFQAVVSWRMQQRLKIKNVPSCDVPNAWDVATVFDCEGNLTSADRYAKMVVVDHRHDTLWATIPYHVCKPCPNNEYGCPYTWILKAAQRLVRWHVQSYDAGSHSRFGNFFLLPSFAQSGLEKEDMTAVCCWIESGENEGVVNRMWMAMQLILWLSLSREGLDVLRVVAPEVAPVTIDTVAILDNYLHSEINKAINKLRKEWLNKKKQTGPEERDEVDEIEDTAYTGEEYLPTPTSVRDGDFPFMQVNAREDTPNKRPRAAVPDKPPSPDVSGRPSERGGFES